MGSCDNVCKVCAVVSMRWPSVGSAWGRWPRFRPGAGFPRQELWGRAAVFAGPQVQGKGKVFVCHQVPAQAVECVSCNLCNLHAFPGEALRFPGPSFASPGEDGVMADEEQELVVR